jgi:anti-sigma B factor antagonist
MTIDERAVGDVTVLDLSGQVTAAKGDMLLRDKIHSLVHQGHRQLLLNMANVSYVDSSGLGHLVASYTTVANAGGQLKLLNLTSKIQSLLTITKLLTVFETFDSEAAAVKSFGSAGSAARGR